ncbi:MAG: helix-turn-helix transcriptional regulator [Ktedonobacteraceae bacterium]
MSRYHYGITIREYREKKGMTQAQLADVWPKRDGDIGVSSEYISLVETGKKHIVDSATLRSLCDILDIPYWTMGLSEYDPFNPHTFLEKETSLYDETLNTAENLIKRTWHLRRVAALPYVEEAVSDLNRLFAYIHEQMPPPFRLTLRFQVLYAQLLRLNAVMDVENQRYQEALDKFRQMHTIAVAIDHPATLAIALLGIGTEVERMGRQQEAIDYLEAARDESFRASKHVSALVNAYLARAYASHHQAMQFKRAIDIAQKIATDIKLYYGDGTDFVFHSLSGILAERSYGYLEIKEPQGTLDMKEEIKRQIAIEGNIWLDAWIPLDWARAHLMLGQIEQCVEAGKEFYQKALILQSPHAKSRAVRLLNTLETVGYGNEQSVQDFRRELEPIPPELKQDPLIYDYNP